MLIGRGPERAAIERAILAATGGHSAALGFSGPPGIGKTALLEHAAARGAGLALLRARGIESEERISFASLHELLRPALPLLDQLPGPQVAALEQAFALRPGHAQDRFAVGAATLGLLAALAEDGPLLLLLDDVQWFDAPSTAALRFALRRLVADPVAAILAVREDAREQSLLHGGEIETLSLTGLSREDAHALRPDLAAPAADRLVSATGGNPLALLELAPDADALALAPEGAPLLLSARISAAYLRRAALLDGDARRCLLLAATSDSGDLPTLERAAARLGIDLEALAVAESAGLVTLHAGTVEFRHPLARSAIYADAPAAQRRDAHRALAAALPDRDVDRRAWHLAAAVIGTDDAASAALEQAGTRGRDRSA
ncbi:MAG: AAA family ATPase, partial [Acidobacteriota bacterium]|nr:AAA family ATPase [Acidobacteriota bacterium]